ALARFSTVAPVARGQQSAKAHHQAAEPDPADERLDVDAHGPRIIANRLAQRYVDVARDAGADRDLGHGVALHEVDALFRCEPGDRRAIALHQDRAARRRVARAAHFAHAVEAETVAAQLRAFARRHAQVALGFVALDQRDADHEY